jgi:phage portal protein, SPP1 gp6-like
MAVEYGDTGSFDHRPAAALYEYSNGGRIYWSLFFPGVRYDIGENPNPGTITRDETGFSSEYAILNYEELDVDYVPVVRFANQEDLDGNVIGEVEPFIPTAQRINKTTYDRLLAQHFNSWKVKTVTGLDLPVLKDQDGDPTDQPDEIATDHLKIKLAQEDMLVSDDPETKFGVLDATALEPFVESFKSDIEALAAVSQTPAHALTGQMSNLTPEALAAARGPLMQKVSERKANASASYDTLLQIIADHAGLAELADDPMLRVTWQDTEIRSMSQAVDALGKAAQMLGVPKRALWPLIPNIERSTIEEWERLADEELESDPMNALFQRQTARNEDEVTGG